MRKSIVLAIVCSLANSAYAFEKDRGGDLVPYAEGAAFVTLTRSHSTSLVTIEGDAAQLLFKALKVEAQANNDLLAKAGEDIVKEKGNVRCVTGSAKSKVVCLIRIQN